MFYKRKIFNSLKKAIKEKEIIILTGMRRTGKTTLFRMIFEEINSKNKVFLDLENPLEQKIFEEKDYNNVIRNFEEFGINTKSLAYIFLDEIQAMPPAVLAVKYLYDHYNLKFFLTGSSSFYLKNLFGESLAGRKFIFELFPLDFEEFLIFKGIHHHQHQSFKEKMKRKNLIRCEKLKKYYQEYLNFGGFPDVVLAEKKEIKQARLNDIFKSYFEKDVKVLADFREIRNFRDLILLLMQRIGSKIEVSKMSSEFGISRETVYSYLSFLESTYFISFITPYTKNVDREISGSRKVYLCDNGLVNNMAKVSGGSLFENSVFLNLRKYGKINYYQKRSGPEIDFILNGRIALEAKSKGSEVEYRALKRTAAIVDLNQSYLITQDFHEDNYSVPALEL